VGGVKNIFLRLKAQVSAELKLKTDADSHPRRAFLEETFGGLSEGGKSSREAWSLGWM
jgi:hypothetical protein